MITADAKEAVHRNSSRGREVDRPSESEAQTGHVRYEHRQGQNQPEKVQAVASAGKRFADFPTVGHQLSKITAAASSIVFG